MKDSSDLFPCKLNPFSNERLSNNPMHALLDNTEHPRNSDLIKLFNRGQTQIYERFSLNAHLSEIN